MTNQSIWRSDRSDGGGDRSARRVATDRAVPLLVRIVLLAAALGFGLAAPAAPPASIARPVTLSQEEIESRLREADEAKRASRPADAQALYRQVLAINPHDDRAYDALVDLASATPLDSDSPVLESAKKLLTTRFRTYQTKRFVVLSDADSQWTMTQAGHLERTNHQFQRIVERLGLRALPLRHKLVCILFEHRADYQAFALAGDGVAEPWMNGYYSPSNDWTVFYRTESNPSIEEARTKLGEMQDGLRELDRRATDLASEGHDAEADSLRVTLAQRQRHFHHESDRVNQFAEQVAVATTVHEAIHQLMFHTGVQSQRVQYPLWICEGLATSFETETPRHAFGPDFEFAPRREVFDEMLTGGRLMPLRQLVVMTEVPITGGDLEALQVLYHESYGLLTWLYRARRDELAQYMEAMAQETGHAADPQRLLAIFQESFGDVDALESAWLRQEQTRVAKSTKTAAVH